MMSAKDTATRLKAQQAASQSMPQKRTGQTRYRMAAAQVPQDATRVAQELDARARSEEFSQRKASQSFTNQPAMQAPPMAFTQVGNAPAASGDATSAEENVRGLWKSRVLASYKGLPKDANLVHRATMTGRAALAISDHYKENAVKENMIAFVDRLFDVFQNCAYEMNQFATGTELELNWIRPFLSKEGSGLGHTPDNNLIVTFSGRISTRRWTMVVKGTLESIQVFILPADKLIGFGLSTANFRPFFSMEPACEGLDVNWYINGSSVRDEMVPVIQRELFNGLIRHATGEANPNECFDLLVLGLAPARNTVDEESRQRYYQDGFMEDIHDSMNGRYQSKPISSRLNEGVASNATEENQNDFDEPLPSHIRRELELLKEGMNLTIPEHQQPVVPQAQPLPSQTVPMQAGPRVANVNFANASHVNMPQQGHPGAHQVLPQANVVPSASGAQVMTNMMNAAGILKAEMAAEAARAAQLAQAAPIAQAPQVAQASPQAPLPQPAMPAVPTGPMNLPASLNILIMSIDRELEIVAKAGAEAFNSKQFARADAALKFSARLNEYRKTSQELLDYYRRKR